MIAKFGPELRTEPLPQGFGLFGWAMPFAALGVGLVIVPFVVQTLEKAASGWPSRSAARWMSTSWPNTKPPSSVTSPRVSNNSLMLIAAVIVLVAIALALPLLVRPSALPEPEPVSPTRHLEDKRDIIYENLRDLQGEYLMGKLSDEDYQQIKRDLQRELAEVLAEIDRV